MTSDSIIERVLSSSAIGCHGWKRKCLIENLIGFIRKVLVVQKVGQFMNVEKIVTIDTRRRFGNRKLMTRDEKMMICMLTY